jgi:hypothetical protein
MDPKLADVVRFLNDNRVKATYGAVAELLGVRPISMGRRLGQRHREASWIVSAQTGRPTGYEPGEIHPEVFTTEDVIRTGPELAARMERTNAGAAP